MVLGLVYGYIPFFILPLFAALDRIDRQRARGVAGPRHGARCGRSCGSPCRCPCQGLLAAAVITALPMFGDYYTADLLSGSPRTSMIGNQIEFYLFEGSQKNAGASLVVILSVLLMVGDGLLPGPDRPGHAGAPPIVNRLRTLVVEPVAPARLPGHGHLALRPLVAGAGADRHPVLVQRRPVAQHLAGLLVALVVATTRTARSGTTRRCATRWSTACGWPCFTMLIATPLGVALALGPGPLAGPYGAGVQPA